VSTVSLQAAEPPPSLRFDVYGECWSGHEIHRKLCSMMMNFKPDLILLTGDLVPNGKDPESWKDYDAVTGDMRKEVSVYAARGSNDDGGSAFSQRLPSPVTGSLFYSFDRAQCHFTAIDSSSSFSPGSAQYSWVENDLSNAARKNQQTFVFFCQPPYSIGSRGCDEECRKSLCPLFIQYHVRAVFNGRDRMYYRTIRDGIPYVVTGGGGAAQEPCLFSKALPDDRMESVHHFVVCQVTGPRLIITAVRDDGTILDQFIAPQATRPAPQRFPGKG
jgi:hypothetical protein